MSFFLCLIFWGGPSKLCFFFLGGEPPKWILFVSFCLSLFFWGGGESANDLGVLFGFLLKPTHGPQRRQTHVTFGMAGLYGPF